MHKVPKVILTILLASVFLTLCAGPAAAQNDPASRLSRLHSALKSNAAPKAAASRIPGIRTEALSSLANCTGFSISCGSSYSHSLFTCQYTTGPAAGLYVDDYDFAGVGGQTITAVATSTYLFVTILDPAGNPVAVGDVGTYSTASYVIPSFGVYTVRLTSAFDVAYTVSLSCPGSTQPTPTPGRGRDTPTPGPPPSTPTPTATRTPTPNPTSPPLAGGASTTNGWFAFVGHVAGVAQSLFRTDLWLYNPDTINAAIANLLFHSQSGAEASKSVALGPGETKWFPDVTYATLGAGDGQVGSLEWRSTSNLMGGISVYTDGPGGGTYGFSVPAMPFEQSMKPKTSASDTMNMLHLFAMNSGDPAFRVNLDITNTSNTAVPVEVRVVDPFTQRVYGGTQFYTIPPRSLLRAGRILERVGAPLMDGLRITVAITEGTVIGPGGGGIMAVATTLDNRSNDGVAFVGQAR